MQTRCKITAFSFVLTISSLSATPAPAENVYVYFPNTPQPTQTTDNKHLKGQVFQYEEPLFKLKHDKFRRVHAERMSKDILHNKMLQLNVGAGSALLY